MNATEEGRTSWCCNYEPLLEATVLVGFRTAAELCPRGVAWSGVRGKSYLFDPALALTRATGSALASSTMVGLAFWALSVARLHHESVVFGAAGAFSMLFHIAESLDREVLWIAPQHWHRLDNTFAVYAFCLVALGATGLHSRSVRRARAETLRAIALLCALLAQEVNAWSMVGGALLPALLITTCCAVDIAQSGARRARLIVLCFRVDAPLGAGCVAISTLCFALSLDRGVDHLRILHGLWHVLLSVGYFLLLRGAVALDALRRDGSGRESGRESGGVTLKRARLRGEVPSGCCCGLHLSDILESVATRGGGGRAARANERERAVAAGEGAPLLSAARTPRPRHPRLSALSGRRGASPVAEVHDGIESPLGTDSYYENVESPLLPSPLHLADNDSLFFDSDASPIRGADAAAGAP